MTNRVLNNNVKEALKNAPGVNDHYGILRLYFQEPGKPNKTRKSTKMETCIENIEVAKTTLSAIKRDISNGRYKNDLEGFWSEHFPLDTTYANACINTVACFEGYIKENENKLSDSVRDKLKTALNWIRYFGYGHRSLMFLTKEVLDNIRQRTVTGNKNGKFQGCAASTVKEYTNTLNKVLNYAVVKKYINSNPIPLLESIVSDDNNWDEIDDDIRPFSQIELDLLLAVVHVPRVKLMIKLLAWTGMRHGELKALAWEDINLVDGTIEVKYNLTRSGNLKTAKTKASVRKINLLPAAIDVLEEMKKLTYDIPPRLDVIRYKNRKDKRLMRRRVFLSRANEPYKRPELTTKPKQWENWLIKAGLVYRPAYQLRHTFASRLLMAGASPYWLSQQIGHSDTNMIGKIYGKWIPNENNKYVEQLAINLGQIKSNNQIEKSKKHEKDNKNTS